MTISPAALGFSPYPVTPNDFVKATEGDLDIRGEFGKAAFRGDPWFENGDQWAKIEILNGACASNDPHEFTGVWYWVQSAGWDDWEVRSMAGWIAEEDQRVDQSGDGMVLRNRQDVLFTAPSFDLAFCHAKKMAIAVWDGFEISQGGVAAYNNPRRDYLGLLSIITPIERAYIDQQGELKSQPRFVDGLSSKDLNARRKKNEDLLEASDLREGSGKGLSF